MSSDREKELEFMSEMNMTPEEFEVYLEEKRDEAAETDLVFERDVADLYDYGVQLMYAQQMEM